MWHSIKFDSINSIYRGAAESCLANNCLYFCKCGPITTSNVANREFKKKKYSIIYEAQYNINPLLTPKICYFFLYTLYIATYLLFSLIRETVLLCLQW